MVSELCVSEVHEWHLVGMEHEMITQEIISRNECAFLLIFVCNGGCILMCSKSGRGVPGTPVLYCSS